MYAANLFAKNARSHLTALRAHKASKKPCRDRNQKKEMPIRQKTFLILQHDQHVLLEKRPATGIWGGLWSTPELTDFVDEQSIKQFCQQKRFAIKNLHFAEIFRHTFSHYHLEILPVFITLKTKPSKIMDSDQQIWYNLQHAQTVGLPAPIKKILLEQT